MLAKKTMRLNRLCLFLLTAAAVCWLESCAATKADAAATPEKVQPVVITTEMSIKKTGAFARNLDMFLVPVAAIGSGKCKATLALAEPLDGEFISLVCWGICCGPYCVFDYKAATSSYSVSTTVTVETWGAIFVVATIAGPADHFPKKCTVTVQF